MKKVVSFSGYVLAFALLGIIFVQVVFIKKEKELIIRQFNRAAGDAISDAANKISESAKEKVINLYRSDNRMLLDLLSEKDTSLPLEPNPENLKHFFGQLALRRYLDKNDVQEIIERELDKRSIDYPFEFAITYNGVPTNVKTLKYQKKKIEINVPLFKNIDAGTRYRLSVTFDSSDVFGTSFLLLEILGFIFIFIILTIYLFTLFQSMKNKHLIEMKNDFINNITHEFKTPIATINLVIDSMKSPAVISNPEKLREYLNILKQENKRMLDQVEKILFLGKLEQNKVLWNETEVELHEIIQKAVEQIKFILKKKNGKIIADLEAENDLVKGDPLFLMNLFVNLLDNAIKYNNNEPVIEIRTYNKNNFIVVEIKDNGVGMNRQVQSRIFEKFYRKPSGDVHSVRGHGIGLTLVKQVMDKMNGHIYVESEEGKGTEFSLYFPLIGKETE